MGLGRRRKESLTLHRRSKSDVIWQGSTWDGLPSALMWLAPVCCLTRRWRITSEAVEFYNCGPGSARDSIALSQIESIRYGGSSLSCIGRGTITFVSFHQEFPVLRITLNNALRVYEELQDAWEVARSRKHARGDQDDLWTIEAAQ